MPRNWRRVLESDVVERVLELGYVDRYAIEEPLSRLCVAEHCRERLAQLVRKRARELPEHGDAAQTRELETLRARFALRAFSIRNVPHDAEDLVAIATDDACLVETLGVIGTQCVLDFLGRLLPTSARESHHPPSR